MTIVRSSYLQKQMDDKRISTEDAKEYFKKIDIIKKSKRLDEYVGYFDRETIFEDNGNIRITIVDDKIQIIRFKKINRFIQYFF